MTMLSNMLLTMIFTHVRDVDVTDVEALRLTCKTWDGLLRPDLGLFLFEVKGDIPQRAAESGRLDILDQFVCQMKRGVHPRIADALVDVLNHASSTVTIA